MKKINGRRVLLFGDINEENVKKVMEEITELYEKDKNKWITLYIGSYGGEVQDAFAFYEYITVILKPKLRTVILGCVKSAALIVYLTGKKEERIIGSLAQIYMHELFTSFEKPYPVYATEQKHDSADTQRYAKIYCRILKKHTKVTKQQLLEMQKNFTYIYPRQAIKLGIAHKILK